MKVCGFASFVLERSICPRPTSELHSRRPTTIPSSPANLSINMNPRLWRVHSYSLPGLPKPTISISDCQLPIADYLIPKLEIGNRQCLILLPRPLRPSCPCQLLRVRQALHLQSPAPPRPLPSRYRQSRSPAPHQSKSRHPDPPEYRQRVKRHARRGWKHPDRTNRESLAVRTGFGFHG